MLLVFQFDGRKSGDIIISSSLREELEQRINDLRFTLHAMIGFLENRVKFYRSTIEKSLNEHKSYFSNDDLMQLHQKLKNEILAQADAGDFRIVVCSWHARLF